MDNVIDVDLESLDDAVKPYIPRVVPDADEFPEEEVEQQAGKRERQGKVQLHQRPLRSRFVDDQAVDDLGRDYTSSEYDESDSDDSFIDDEEVSSVSQDASSDAETDCSDESVSQMTFQQCSDCASAMKHHLKKCRIYRERARQMIQRFPVLRAVFEGLL